MKILIKDIDLAFKDGKTNNGKRKLLIWMGRSEDEIDNSENYRRIGLVYKQDRTVLFLETIGGLVSEYEGATEIFSTDLIFDEDLRWKLKEASKRFVKSEKQYRGIARIRCLEILRMIKEIEGGIIE